MLEMTRVFGKYKDQIKRSIYFLYWNGHEIAEAMQALHGSMIISMRKSAITVLAISI